MEKGNLGIRLAFYGVAAFALAWLGYSTALFLLAGVVIVAEKNEWASRQVIQAICLCVVGSVVGSVLDIFDFIYKIPFVGTAWGVIIGIITSLVDIAILVFCILAIVRNAKGKEANVPLANKFADWAYGIVRVKPVVQPQAGPQAFCTGCGAPLNGGAFCNVCGKPVGQPAPQQAPQQVAPQAPQQPQQ